MARSGGERNHEAEAGVRVQPRLQPRHQCGPGAQQSRPRFAAGKPLRFQFAAHVAGGVQVLAKGPLLKIEATRVVQPPRRAQTHLETPGFAGARRLETVVPADQNAPGRRRFVPGAGDAHAKTANAGADAGKFVDHPGHNAVHAPVRVRHALLQAQLGKRQGNGGAQEQRAQKPALHSPGGERGERKDGRQQNRLGRRRQDQENQADAGQPCNAQRQHRRPGRCVGFSRRLPPAGRRAAPARGPCAGRDSDRG